MIDRVSLLHAALVLVLGLATGGYVFASETKQKAEAVAEALQEVDKELAAFEKRMNDEASAVTKAAMKTRFVVLKQRRADLEKRFTPERHAALLADLRKEVNVTATETPAVDPNEGRVRRTVRLEDAVPSVAETHRAEALAAKQRDEQFRAARAEELASQRRIEIARLESDLARLAAQIDSSTVGDPNRRSELNLRLRELESQKRRLEMAPQPSGLEQLRMEIQRETEKTQR
jgi:hypothetical protein